MNCLSFHHKALHWATLFAFSFLLLQWLSPDSYLMEQYGIRYDASWFFSCGKAWMEGLTPYVDFADSKGPLLWLIYGVGYLLSPRSYHGVFWLSVVCYMVAFHFVWRTARLWLRRRTSALVVAALPFFLFFVTYHNEVRAEDFCMPAFCGGLCFMCRALQGSSTAASGTMGGVKSAFRLGFCMMWGLLIKWNTFFMMGGMALAVAIDALRHRRPMVVFGGVAGMAVLALPFLVYFLVAGNLGAFVQEYFVNTFAITEDSYLHCYYRDKAVLTVVFLLLALFCRRMRTGYWLLLAYLPFYVFLFSRAVFLHYFATAMPFMVFPLIGVAHALQQRISRLPRWSIAALLVVICAVCIRFNFHASYLPTPDTKAGVRVAVMKYMARKDKPRIMFSDGDSGHGLLSRGLPACKYWSQQKHASAAMRKAREQAVKQRCADYIVLNNLPEVPPNFLPLVKHSGYRQCYAPVTEHGKTQVKPLPLFERVR